MSDNNRLLELGRVIGTSLEVEEVVRQNRLSEAIESGNVEQIATEQLGLFSMYVRYSQRDKAQALYSAMKDSSAYKSVPNWIVAENLMSLGLSADALEAAERGSAGLEFDIIEGKYPQALNKHLFFLYFAIEFAVLTQDGLTSDRVCWLKRAFDLDMQRRTWVSNYLYDAVMNLTTHTEPDASLVSIIRGLVADFQTQLALQQDGSAEVEHRIQQLSDLLARAHSPQT